MAHKKGGGATSKNRDSAGKRLGIKISAGQTAKIGNIIVRQRGTKYLPGKNVKVGSDDTIYAMKDGVVKFVSKQKKLFNGTRRSAKVVSVESAK